MNKFLTKSSNIDEDAVKKLVNNAIDLSCVTYDGNKNVAIENSDNDVLYTLPKTVGPPGYVIAAGLNGDLIFTNSPIPDMPYLTNPLNSDLTMGGYDILGAGHVRPNTLEVATTSILPIINGNTRFNDSVNLDNLTSNRNLINVGSNLTMLPNKIITSDNFSCTGVMHTNFLSSSGGSTIGIDRHVDMSSSNLRASSIVSNIWNPVSTGNTLTVGATVSSQNDIMTAGSLWTNTIQPRTGNTIALTSTNVTMNSVASSSSTVAGSITSTSLSTNTIGSRSGSYINIVNDMVLGNNNIFVKNLENVNKISFVPQTLQPTTILDNLSLIQSDGNLSLSPSLGVVVNSDLDMTSHNIKNANFQDCETIDYLNASVASLDNLYNQVNTISVNVDNLQITTTNNSHRINLLDDKVVQLQATSDHQTGAINDIISNLALATTLINDNINAITDLDTTTQTQTSEISGLDNRVTAIETNIVSINNTISQKSIAPKQYTLVSGVYSSISDIDSSYTSNSAKNIDIVQGTCYNIDYSYYLSAVGGSSITLNNRLTFGPGYILSSALGSLPVNSYFVNFCISFVVQSYNPSSKNLAIMYKCNTTYTNANDPSVNKTLSYCGSLSGTNNNIESDNKVVLDIGLHYTGVGNTAVQLTRNFGIVSKII